MKEPQNRYASIHLDIIQRLSSYETLCDNKAQFQLPSCYTNESRRRIVQLIYKTVLPLTAGYDSSSTWRWTSFWLSRGMYCAMIALISESMYDCCMSFQTLSGIIPFSAKSFCFCFCFSFAKLVGIPCSTSLAKEKQKKLRNCFFCFSFAKLVKWFMQTYGIPCPLPTHFSACFSFFCFFLLLETFGRQKKRVLTYTCIMLSDIQKISMTFAVIATPRIWATAVRALASKLLFAFIDIC